MKTISKQLRKPTYKIIRRFFESRRKFTIKTGLTLNQAQAHCQDPETSSSTCVEKHNIYRTRCYGAWFDGYEEEK